MSPDIIEALAELEHEQWMAWAKAVASEVSPSRELRWRQYMRPYHGLPREVQEKDREWARRVVKRLLDLGFAIVPQPSDVSPSDVDQAEVMAVDHEAGVFEVMARHRCDGAWRLHVLPLPEGSELWPDAALSRYALDCLSA